MKRRISPNNYVAEAVDANVDEGEISTFECTCL